MSGYQVCLSILDRKSWKREVRPRDGEPASRSHSQPQEGARTGLSYSGLGRDGEDSCLVPTPGGFGLCLLLAV